MQFFLVLLIVILFTSQSFFCKLYTIHYPGCSKNTTAVFVVVSGVITGILAFVFAGFSFSVSHLTILLGIGNAIILYLYDYFFVKASGEGPYSVQSSILVVSGLLIPPLYSLLVFHDQLGWVRLVLITLIVGCALLIIDKPNVVSEQKVTLKFILNCLALALFNGLYAIMWDIQQRLDLSAEKEEMVAITFIGAAAIALVLLLIKKPNQLRDVFRQNVKSGLYLLVSSFASAFAILGLVYVLRFVNVTVLYTWQNAGILLISMLASCVLLKEKISVKNLLGCFGMSIMLVLFSLADRLEAIFC